MKTGFEVESSGQIQTLPLDHCVTVTMIFIIHCPPSSYKRNDNNAHSAKTIEGLK